MKKLLMASAFVAILTLGQVGQALAATPTPTTADGFTQAFAAKNDQTWSGADQSTSFKAPNGKIYWLFGDTLLSNGVDPDGSYPDTGTTMVGNRILLQQGGEFVNAMANGGVGVPDPATRTADNDERYWAQAIQYDNGYMYVLAARVIRNPSPDSMGFSPIGVELAKYSVRSDGRLNFIKMIATPSTGIEEGTVPTTIQWSGDMIKWGSYMYVYGSLRAPQPNPNWAAHYGYVARVPLGQLENRLAWRFYKKSTSQWVASMTQLSTDISNPDAIVDSQIASVRAMDGKVVMAHKPWNGWGSTVFVEVASSPQGAFTRYPIFESPAGTWEGKNYQTYAPMLHPEQTLGGAETGKLLVSVNWNGQDFWTDTLGNADLYKPRFYAIDKAWLAPAAAKQAKLGVTPYISRPETEQ